MKKRLALVLAVMLLLSACAPKDSPEPSTTGTQNSTTEAPVTEGPTEGEEASWYAQEAATPISYSDSTTKDIPYSGAKWLISGEKGATFYEIAVNGGVLEVRNVLSFGDPAHTITLPEELASAVALGGDGRVGYVATDTQIAAVDLQTEEVKILAEADRLLDAVMVSYDVIYYVNKAEGKATIYRLYIPEGKADAIYGDIPVYPASEFRLIPPETTLGKIGWTMMNPEMMELLTKEYATPDSEFKNTSEKFNFTEVWGQPGMIDTYSDNNPLVRSICQAIQETNSTMALMRCWYSPLKDEYTQELGAIDDCFTGTGLQHDHYNPKADAPAVPEVSFGAWEDMGLQPLSQSGDDLLGETMETDTLSALLYANPYEFPTLYAGNPGEPLVQVLNEPVTQWENSLYYIYTITCDGELMQLNLDGTVCNSPYKAKHGQLRDMDYQSGMVFLLDGDFLVQLDLTTTEQRILLEAPDIVDIGYYEENQVYICQSRGLHQKQYILNLETQTLEETFIN